MPHIGVRNRTKEVQHLQFDGRSVSFEPGQVRLIEGIAPDFVSTRMFVSHKLEKDRKGDEVRSQQLVGLRLFDVLTVDEALKAGARPDEDPRVLAARAELEAKAKERRQIVEDVKAALIEDGWSPPKPAKSNPAKKEEEAHDRV